MIRQAISCDICGAEKKQTNHWFVAYETADELRVSGWNSRNRLRAGSKHLCGQACLHKLADDFMARLIGGKAAHVAVDDAELPHPPAADCSLAQPMPVCAPEAESSARLLTPPEPRAPLRPVPLVRMPDRSLTHGSAPVLEEPVRMGGASRREEAWRRERERTLRASERA